MRLLLTDTETIGLNPPPAPASGVVEIAYLEIDSDTLEITNEFYSRVNPGCEIHPKASEVHGIYDKDVQDCKPLGEVFNPKEAVVNVGHNCLTGDHEVLTPNGWQRLDSLQGLSVNAATWRNGQVEFEESLVVRNPYQGAMLSWDTEFHKGIYTPDHDIVHTKTRHLLGGGSPVWEKVSAKVYSELGANSVAIPSAGVLATGEGALDISPLEARIIEMVRADGNVETNGSIRLKFSKPRKIARAKALLDAAGAPYSERPANADSMRISLLASDLKAKIYRLFSTKKAYGPWVLQMSLEARLDLLDEVQYWDGYTGDQGPNRQVSVSSVHESDLDWLQTLSVTAGKSARRFDMFPNTRGFSTGRLIGKVNLRTRSYVKTLQKPTIVSHNGTVYCLTTSAGSFIVRRKGAVWVTGNCSFDLKFLSPHYDNLVGSLCTLALARQYITDSPNHKLGTLVEHLGLPKGDAHNALADCYMTYHLLRHIVDKSGRDLKAHIAAARKPKVLHTIPFGKHKGQKVATLPLSYVCWMLEQEIDQDLRYSLEQSLKIRG